MYMNRIVGYFVLLLLIALAFVPLSSAISVSVSGGSGDKVTYNSNTFDLSPASVASAFTLIGDGQSYNELSASGHGGISSSSGGVDAIVAGEDIDTLLTASGPNIVGNAVLSGVPFNIDARFDTGFVGEALAGDGTSLGTILTGPVFTPDGGNAASYWLSGKKWTQLDPQIKMSVNSAGSTLTTAEMQGAVSSAAETWDAATNQNLFSDGGAVVTTAVQGKYDKQNVISFLKYNPGCTALASAGTWYQIYKPGTHYQERYTGKPGNEYPIVESDIAFNSNYRWSTTGASGTYDFQSVALHEMGHTIGLGDLYNKAQFSTDRRQVMHYYTGVKRTLGNGDSAGVWKLYG